MPPAKACMKLSPTPLMLRIAGGEALFTPTWAGLGRSHAFRCQLLWLWGCSANTEFQLYCMWPPTPLFHPSFNFLCSYLLWFMGKLTPKAPQAIQSLFMEKSRGGWVFRGSWDQAGGGQRPSLCWGLEKTPSPCSCQRLRLWAHVLNPSCAEEAC